VTIRAMMLESVYKEASAMGFHGKNCA